MELIGFWFVCAIIVAIIASSRGRSGFGWFLLAMIFSPLLMGILVLCMGRPSDSSEDKPTAKTHVRCPDCRELVRYDATKCKHCSAALIAQPPPKRWV